MSVRRPQEDQGIDARRWFQLALGIVCMAAVANLQYGWALFVTAIDAKTHWGRGEIQQAFTIFIFTSTWAMPLAGYAADRAGARRVVMAGGVLAALAWTINATAASLAMLYAGAVIGGVGMAAVYGACIGHALKWFSAQRGFAVGLIAAGFGTASAATVLPIRAVIEAQGYEHAFLYFGIGQGALVVLAAAFLMPPVAQAHSASSPATADYAALGVLRAPAFWTMYLMFLLAALGGVMAIAQLAPIAKEYQVANTPVWILDLALPALTFALAIDRVFSGLSKPLFGWLSDRLGREETLCLAFALEAGAIVALGFYGRNPLAFVLLTGVIFLGWGQIYSLFPALCADTFGSRRAATHAGLLFTAKGVAALTALQFSSLLLPTIEWQPAFYGAALLNALAAMLAIVVLKPLRARSSN